MRKLLFISLLFGIILNSYGQIINLSPDSTLFDLHLLPPTAAFDSVDLERMIVTNTFLLDNGVVVALVDTITPDTVRAYITGSDQPAPITTIDSISLDTSFQIGLLGVQFDSIILTGGQVYWYSEGSGFNIGKPIYTTPGAPATLTISSPDSDTLTYAVSDFPILANNTDADSCMVRWDTIAIPDTVTDGNLVYRGDTTVAETDFFIDMDDSLKVYVSAFAKNDTGTAIGAWSVAKVDSVWIDSTGAAFSYLSTFYSDTILARWSNDPTPEGERDLILDTLFYRLDTITDGGAEISVLRKADLQYILASHNTDDSRMNTAIQGGLVGNFTLTAAAAGLTFSQDNGWTGNNAGAFTTGWDPVNEASQYSLDDASYAVWSNHNDAGSEATYDIGAVGGGGLAYTTVGHNNSNRFTRINQASSFNPGGGAQDSVFWFVQRTASNALASYIDGAFDDNSTIVSSTMPNADFYIFARNDGGLDSPTSRELSFVYVGGTLTVTQISNFYVVLTWYRGKLGF